MLRRPRRAGSAPPERRPPSFSHSSILYVWMFRAAGQHELTVFPGAHGAWRNLKRLAQAQRKDLRQLLCSFRQSRNPGQKNSPREGGLFLCSGGEDGNRTRLNGFAGRCITSLLPRQRILILRCSPTGRCIKKGKPGFPFRILEREKSLELSTSTLARLRSTN
jgi:hypothetical protein